MFSAFSVYYEKRRQSAFMPALTAACLCASPALAQTSSEMSGNDLGLIILLLAIFFVYFIPTFIAFGRGHPNRWVIAVINTVFGGTGLGWLGSLVWALKAIHKSPTGSAGGESGLNLFINDPKTIAATPVTTQSSIIDQLTQLKSLHDKGVITEDEFDRLKQPLMIALLN